MSYKITCPNNTFLCKKDIEEIIGKVKSFEESIDPNKCGKQFDIDLSNKKAKDITSCPKVDGGKKCNNCDYLFENLILGKTSCKELYERLKEMNNSEITEQIKYNLNQLIQTRLKLKAQKLTPKFGTWDWWKRYIWGANKIQNYIYIVSFIMVAIIVIFYVFEMLSEVDNILWSIFIVIVSIILLIIRLYYTFNQQTNYTLPEGDKRYIQTNKDRYPKDIKKGLEEEDTGYSLFSFEYLLPLILLGLFIIGTIISKYVENEQVKSIFRGLALYFMVAYIFSINTYYTFFIPQFLIIAIVLQKIVVTNFFKDNIFNWIFYFGFFALLFLISSYGWILEVISGRTHYKDNCGEKKPVNIMPYLQYWIIILVLIVSIIFRDIGLYENTNFIKERRGWGLFMEPMYYGFESLFKKFTAKKI